MARKPRLFLPDLAHLIVMPALPGVPAFRDAADREAFLLALREAAATEQVQMFGWALLPGEVRLLASAGEGARLSRLVQSLGRRYVSAYNRRHGRSGTLWSGRFRSAALEPGSSVLSALQLVDGASDEPGWTSASHRCGGMHQMGIGNPPEYWALGNTPFERETAWRRRLETPLPPGVQEQIWHAVRGGWPLGSEHFKMRIAAGSPRAVKPGRPGRPRGSPERTAG